MTIPQIKQFLEDKPGYQKWGAAKLADFLGVTEAKVKEARDTIGSNRDDYANYDSLEQENNDNVNRPNTNNFTAARDQTLQEYCESIGLDYSRIDPYNDVKYWTDGAGRRRYSIVPKKFEEEEYSESILEAIKELTPPALHLPKCEKDYGLTAGLINIYDAHIDKLSEVGEGHTIKDNIGIIKTVAERLFRNMAPHDIDILYFPVGHDFFNTNGSDNVTKAGTPQNNSVHWKTSFQLGVQAIADIAVSGLEIARQVEFVPIEGNHDEDKVFYLNEVLKAMFASNDRIITSDCSSPMQHRKFGDNLLSFAHGKHEKKRLNDLPLNVAEEVPKLWGTTKYREMFLGDQHHKMEYRFLRKLDVRGYTVNYLRDISFNHSTWDRNNAYHIGHKSIEAHLFSKYFGQFANYRFNF